MSILSNRREMISIKNLWKVYGKNPERALDDRYGTFGKREFQEQLRLVIALQQVNLDVKKGETFVVMGLSGSGKSTLVRCLIRLIEPTVGTIDIDGEDIRSIDSKRLIEFRRSKVAMVFQHYGLLPHRTVIDNAAWGLEIRGMQKSERYREIMEVLKLVGLDGWEHAYPRELSGGMQQRVGLARALALNPDILLMDEPFSGLDPLIRRNMQDELMRIQKELNKTIVFITHDLNEALKLGDRIAIMRDGAIIQIGRPEDIVLNPEDQYVAEFTKDVRRESMLTVQNVMVDPTCFMRYDGTLHDALEAMQNTSSDVAVILSYDDTYYGLVTKNHVQVLLESGRNEPNDEIRSLFPAHVATISKHSSLANVVPIFMSGDPVIPIPVVDENNILVGLVHREAVSRAMSSE